MEKKRACAQQLLLEEKLPERLQFLYHLHNADREFGGPFFFVICSGAGMTLGLS